jgi:hypothetical protein
MFRETWERFDRIAPWKAAVIAGMVAWILTTFLYSPPFWVPLAGGGPAPARIDDFNALCANPLARDLNEPILAYRILTPALAWLLGLRGFSGVILQYLAIPATLGLVFHAVSGRSGRSTALLATIGVACSYATIWTNTKPGFPDSITHLAVASLLVSNQRGLLVLMSACGTLNDERFVLAVPFILLWHASSGSLLGLVKEGAAPAASILFGLLIAALVRFALESGRIGPGIEIPELYDELGSLERRGPHDGWSSYLVNVVMSYRWLWLVFVFALVRAAPWNAARSLYVLSLVLVVIASGGVADVSRSIGFAYPAFLIAVCDLPRIGSRPNRWLLPLVLSCLATPCFHVNQAVEGKGLNLQLERPLPFSILRAATGWDVLDPLKKLRSGLASNPSTSPGRFSAAGLPAPGDRSLDS